MPCVDILYDHVDQTNVGDKMSYKDSIMRGMESEKYGLDNDFTESHDDMVDKKDDDVERGGGNRFVDGGAKVATSEDDR